MAQRQQAVTDTALSRRSKVLYGTIGGAVLAAGVLVPALTSTPHHAGSTSVSAAFGRAGQGLDRRSEVKVRGVVVGGVDSIRLDDHGRALVTLRLDKGLRVPEGAIAAIEPVSIFGPKDVTLDLGPAAGTGPYLRDGGTITRTRDPQDPADTAAPALGITSALDPQDLATVLHTFAQGLSGQGPALRRSIGNGAALVDLAHTRRAEIGRLLADIGALGRTLGGRGDTIAGTAADLGSLAPVVNARSGNAPDKVARLLEGAGRLSDSAAARLRARGDDIGALVDSAGDTVAVLHGQRRDLAMLPAALTRFFQGIADALNVEGPQGSILLNARADYPVDPCYILRDVCQAAAPRR